MINNNRQEDGGGEEQDYRFTPKKVLFYCITVGLYQLAKVFKLHLRVSEVKIDCGVREIMQIG